MRNFNWGGRGLPIAYSLWPKAFIIIFCVLFSGFLASPVYGQEAEGLNKIKALQVGDTLPRELTTLINSVYSPVSNKSKWALEEIRGKVILLDFLATGCRSCIEALPRLNAIQKKYQDKVQLILITGESEDRLRRFVQNNDIMKENNIPVIYSDRLLKRYFPHNYISHMVWIDQQGRVGAITNESHVQDFTMTSFIKGTYSNWPLKIEQTEYFAQPLVELTPRSNATPHNQKRSLQYAMLTGYTEGIGPYDESHADSIQKVKRISYRNRSVLELYLIAVNRLYKLKEDQIILRVADRSKYDLLYADLSATTSDMWLRKNSYCYERTIPRNLDDAAWRSLMLCDLNAFLQLKGSVILVEGKEFLLLEDDSYNKLKNDSQ